MLSAKNASDSNGDKRLKIFWKHLENSCKFHNVDCKFQIEVLISTIPACGVSALSAPVTSKIHGLRRTEGWADKYTIAKLTDHMLYRRQDGYFDPLYFLHKLGGEVPLVPHTFTDGRDAIVEGKGELIVNIVENCGDMAHQFRTYYVHVIIIVLIQKVQRVIDLEELTSVPRA